jgi:hypothetical protein
LLGSQVSGTEAYLQEVEADSEDSAASVAIDEAEVEALKVAAFAAAASGRTAAAALPTSGPSLTCAAAGSIGDSLSGGVDMGIRELSGQQLGQGEGCSADPDGMDVDDMPAPARLEPCLDFRLPDGVLAGLKVLQLTSNRNRQALEKAAAAGPRTQQGRKGQAYWQQQLADVPVRKLDDVVAIMERLEVEAMSPRIIEAAIWADQ